MSRIRQAREAGDFVPIPLVGFGLLAAARPLDCCIDDYAEPEGASSQAPTAGLVFAALAGHRRHRLFDGQGQLLRTIHDEVPEPAQQVLELLGVEGTAYGLT
jgi:hypothetical protein